MVTVRTEPLEGADFEFENRPPLEQTPPPPRELMRCLWEDRRGSCEFQACTCSEFGELYLSFYRLAVSATSSSETQLKAQEQQGVG